MNLPAAPEDLSAVARERWPGLATDVAAACGGAAVDYDLLADLLRAQDRLDQIRAVLANDGLTIAGSKGQLRPHPLLVTESVLRREVAQAYDRLRLTPRQRNAKNRYLQIDEHGRLEEY